MKPTPHHERRSRFRLAWVYPFAVYAVLFLSPTEASLRAGLGFVFAGLLIRLWASGYLMKRNQLTTSGPYSLTRNPLYLGTLFLALGFTIVVRMFYLGPLFLIILAISYYSTIEQEDCENHKRFGEKFISYKKNVPALIPTCYHYRDGDRWPFSVRRMIRNKEYGRSLVIPAVMIFFYLKEELVVERETATIKMWGLAITALILAASVFLVNACARKAQITTLR